MITAIYAPKGAALEYAPLALNLYGDADGKVGGCSHRCDYCYCPGILHISRDRFFCSPRPKLNIIERMEQDCRALRGDNENRRVLLQFIGDPYCVEELEFGVTRAALQIMECFAIPAEVLTKGGTRACRDFDILQRAGGRFGTSLIWSSEVYREIHEPGAAPIADRIEAMAEAHRLGIPTWMSLEPVQCTNEGLGAVRKTLLYVDEYRLGVERNAPYYYDDYWPDFLASALDMLRDAGKKWLVKESLQKYLRGRPATGGPKEQR